LIEYRALLKEYRTLLIHYLFSSIVTNHQKKMQTDQQCLLGAFWIEYRALLMEYRAVLVKDRALFSESNIPELDFVKDQQCFFEPVC